jgi:protein-tyrosine phosphatase
MKEVKSILMVCLGNICRSPVAEGIMRSKLKNKNLNIEVDSAGTSNYYIGENPDTRSTKNALKNGVDISNLKARQFKAED